MLGYEPHIFIFSFYTLYYNFLKYSILNKENNRILMRKHWVYSEIVVFSKGRIRFWS
jgi:hypothetical protein